MTSESWPVEIRVRKLRDGLSIQFDDGAAYDLSAEYLRVESPSAEVKGHAPRQRRIVGGKAQVKIVRLEPVGNYAVRIIFDDGHDTGLYSWAYLRELGVNKDRKWAEYLEQLAAQGLSRESA